MTKNRNDHDEPGRLTLDSVAPRPGWLEQLPALARAAARRRAQRASWGQGFATASRWVLPLAAGLAVACWLAPSRVAPPRPTSAAILLAGTDREALVTMALEPSR